MKKRPKILVVGSFVMDMIVGTNRFPASGETVLGRSFHMAPGGKGANQAIQAARLGADVTMVGKVGNDDFGKRLMESCESSGIHTEYILIDPLVSSAVGNVQLEESPSGTKNRIIVVPGTNMEIKPEEMNFLGDIIDQYDMVMLQLEIPMEINELVAGHAFRKNVPVMLNPAPSAPLSEALLSRLAYISPNEHEAADLTGIAIRKEGKNVRQDDLKAAVAALLRTGAKNAVITLGNAGAVVADPGHFAYEPCIDVVKAKDPTAAGDSFVAAFCVGICAGLDQKQALHFANYAATLTVAKLGAQPSLPTLDEVVGLMRRVDESEFDFTLLDCLKKM